MGKKEDVVELLTLIDQLTSEEACWWDHNGNCQCHYWFGEPLYCPHNEAKKLLNSDKYKGMYTSPYLNEGD